MTNCLPAGQLCAWLGERLYPCLLLGQVSVQVTLTGPLDEGRLSEALAALARRHPVLAIRVSEDSDGQPLLASAAGEVPTDSTDLSGLPPGTRRTECSALASRLGQVPFDLHTDPPVRAHLIKLTAQTHVLQLTAHQVAMNESGLLVLAQELGACYAGTELPERSLTDPAVWEQICQAERAKRLRFWDEQLVGLVPLTMPADRPRPAAPSGAAGRTARMLSEGLSAGIGRLGDGDALPVIMAGLAVVLARISGQADLAIGIDPLTLALTGPGPDRVPVRLNLSDTPTFEEIVRRCQMSWVAASAHRVPLAELARHRGGARDRSRYPFFQVTVTAPVIRADLCWPGQVNAEVAAPVPAALGEDLRLTVVQHGARLETVATFAHDLFDQSRADRLLAELEMVLTAAIAGSGRTLAELPLTGELEQRLLLSEWQGPAIPYDMEPVHEQVRRRARQHPSQVAIRFGTEELTYAELIRRSEALAAGLRARGVRHEEIVAVALGRDIDTCVALLGVLLASAAFVMLDIASPPTRLGYLLADTRASVVITKSGLLERLPEPDGWTPLVLDEQWPQLLAAADTLATQGMLPLHQDASHDSLAYVLYTSGSTGKPKGVLIEHGALSNFLLWLRWLFDLGPKDRLLQHMALVFDFAQGEIFTALTSGVTIVLASEEDRTSPARLGEMLVRERITYLGGTPAVLGRLPRHDYPDLKGMVAGGEAFAAELVNMYAVGDRRFVNGYGPTEAAVGCVYYECEHREWTTQPPIGRAMPNRYAYVVDQWDQLAPIGVPGEILIGGAGLARGYLNDAELTSARFIPDPFQPPGRVYRTGDLGVWTEDGQIRFLGRTDTQVKVNGLRVELEEIESVLTSHPAVLQSAVAVQTDRTGAASLIGYLSVQAEPPSGDELRAYLLRTLPSYMVPARFAVLDALPLNPVGKVDRKALQALAVTAAAFQPPRTPTERELARIVADVLGITGLSVTDDFYALGGDSLLAAAVVARATRLLGPGVTLADFDADPTVAALARCFVHATLQRGPAAMGTADSWQVLGEIAALSDEQVAALLRES